MRLRGEFFLSGNFPWRTGLVFCAANRIGNGFAVKDCQFGFNRSRGIIIKASHGEITGNQLAGWRPPARIAIFPSPAIRFKTVFCPTFW